MDSGYLKKTYCDNSIYKNPSDLIRKLVTLLEHQITRNDVSRHIENIREFLEVSQRGFLLRDLYSVMRLIEILSARLTEEEIYTDLLENIIRICSLPPLIIKGLDVRIFTEDLQQHFSMLGYLLVCLKSERLQDSVVAAITTLLTKTPNDQDRVSLEVRKKAAGNSQLAEILGQLLGITDDQLYSKILELIILVATDSHKTRIDIVRQDALNSLFTRLEPTWRKRYPDIEPGPPMPNEEIPNYEKASTVIWLLLKHMQKNNGTLEGVKNIERFSLWSIKYAFQLFLTSQNKGVDRNNIMAIIIKLLDLFPKIDFVSSGLAKDVATLTMYSVNFLKSSSRNPIVDDNDFIFTKLLLIGIPYYVKFEGGVRILEDVRVIYRLLKIINRTIKPVNWPSAHICVLSNLSWNVLKQIVPYLEEEFIESTGPYKLLHCLHNSRESDDDRSILVKCLGAIYHILKRDHKKVILNSILYNGGISSLLDLCETFIAAFPVITKSVQKCIELVFCSLTILCQQSTENKAIVDIVIKYMTIILHPEHCGIVQDSRIIVCIVDFVWEVILDSKELSNEFMKKGGVYLMLDIVQKFPFPVQLITLGALVDLCDYGDCVPYLITWKGQNGTRLYSLLMEVFRYENNQLKVKSGQCGQILDIKYPLMGKQQWIQTYCLRQANSNPAIYDLFLSCRPKVYAILTLLNERHKEKVEIASEYYKWANYELEANDKVTMLLAENFLAFKLGEAWMEVKFEFEMMAFVLAPTDAKVISSLTERTLRWAEHLKKLQMRILKHSAEKEWQEEENLYNRLADSCLADSLSALNELKYLARTTERMFRVSQKNRQQFQVDKTLKILPDSDFIHKTYLTELHVTPVFEQSVSVRTNVVVEEEEEEPIVTISPMESDTVCEGFSPEDLLSSQDFSNFVWE